MKRNTPARAAKAAAPSLERAQALSDEGSWSGCVEEHIVRAITLRALKLGGEGKSYAEMG